MQLLLSKPNCNFPGRLFWDMSIGLHIASALTTTHICFYCSSQVLLYLNNEPSGKAWWRQDKLVLYVWTRLEVKNGSFSFSLSVLKMLQNASFILENYWCTSQRQHQLNSMCCVPVKRGQPAKPSAWKKSRSLHWVRSTAATLTNICNSLTKYVIYCYFTLLRAYWRSSPIQINCGVLGTERNTFWKEAEANVLLTAAQQLDTTSAQVSSRTGTQQEIYSF